jgi:hypothetical protein
LATCPAIEAVVLCDAGLVIRLELQLGIVPGRDPQHERVAQGGPHAALNGLVHRRGARVLVPQVLGACPVSLGHVPLLLRHVALGVRDLFLLIALDVRPLLAGILLSFGDVLLGLPLSLGQIATLLLRLVALATRRESQPRYCRYRHHELPHAPLLSLPCQGARAPRQLGRKWVPSPYLNRACQQRGLP